MRKIFTFFSVLDYSSKDFKVIYIIISIFLFPINQQFLFVIRFAFLYSFMYFLLSILQIFFDTYSLVLVFIVS